jgi:ABC-type polysaccharide/polyol phosphate export permease
MFATSVVYPIALVGGKLGLLMRLNPMTPIIEGYRSVILFGQPPGPSFAVAAALALLVFVGGWLAFHRAEFRFAENI